MDQSSLQAIRDIVDPLKQWSPKTIPFPSGEVDDDGAPKFINLVDYIGADCKKHGHYVLLEKRPDWSCYGDPKHRAVLTDEIVNSCAEAGFNVYCKGWEPTQLKIKFNCARGRKYKAKKIVSPSKQRVTLTSKPTQDDKICHFYFSISWNVKEECWWMKGGFGCCYHNDHAPVKEEEVNVSTKHLPSYEKEIAMDFFSVHNGSGSVGALLKKRTGRTFTAKQLEYLREQALQKDPTLSPRNSDESNKTSAQQLIDYLRESPDISFVLVTGHPNSSLCSIRKQSARGKAAAKETTRILKETSLPGSSCNEAEEYAASVRRSLKVGDGNEILLAVAWITDQERRLVTLYPEVLASDVTEQTNKEKRSLLVVAGLTANMESFTVCRALLPSCARWVFHWFFTTAMPALVPKKARARNVVNYTDGDEREYNAFIAAIPMYFPKSSHRLCSWHLINRGMKAGAISSHNLGSKGKAYYDVAVKWIKSWSHSIETEEELKHSYRIFERWLASSEVQAEDALTSRLAHRISNFVLKSMIPHSAKWARCNFLYKRTFDRQSTQFVEVENSVMKRHPLGPKPQASLNVAAQAITQLNTSRIENKTKQAAVAMDQTQPGAIWPDMVSYCNQKVVGGLLREHAKVGSRVVAREDTLTYLVKSTSVIRVNHAYDHADFPDYMIPSYSRVRVVKVVSFQEAFYLKCSCGLFQRFGYPCADIYAVLGRPPQPSDVILRYHKEYVHYYCRDHTSKESSTYNVLLNKKFQEAFDTAIAKEPPGPLYSDHGLPIATSDQLAAFKNTLPPAPGLRRECYWSQRAISSAGNVLLTSKGSAAPSVLQCDNQHVHQVSLHVHQEHQEVGLSQAAEQAIMLDGDCCHKCYDSGNNSFDDLNFDDCDGYSDEETNLLHGKSRRAAWLQEDHYKSGHSLYTEVTKLADGNLEASEFWKRGISKLVEGVRKVAAKSSMKNQAGNGSAGAVSSCLELERSLKPKRKRPFGSPGRNTKK